jgi:signal transduction histidine kinase
MSLPTSPDFSEPAQQPTRSNDDGIARALLDLLYQNALLGCLIIWLTSITLCWLHYEQVDQRYALAWLCYMLTVATIRFFLARKYSHQIISKSEFSTWLLRFRIGLAFTCVGWLSTLFVFMPNDTAYQFATALVLAGMAAGGVAVLASDRVSFAMHTISTVVGGGIFLFSQPTSLHHAMGFMAMIITLGLIRSANYMHAALLNALRLAEDKTRIASELRDANDAIAKTNTSLVTEIEVRHQVEAELVSAKDAAIEANRAKGTFLSNMSHEIRTPLNGVIGLIELLETTKLDNEQTMHIRHIKTSAWALLDVISDVLDFSKIDAGRMLAHIEPHMLRDLLESCIDIVRPGATKKSVHIIFNADSSLPERVLTDSVKLRQILLNLIGNAVKFTDHGDVRVSARFDFDNQSATLGRLHITIIDTGIGISDASMAKLFQPFVQADDSAARRFGGTGLGLVIAKELITLLNGELRFTSQIGIGTVVEITLPMECTELVARSPAKLSYVR